MGGILGKTLANFMSKPEMRILMVGLDAAGKVSSLKHAGAQNRTPGARLKYAPSSIIILLTVLLSHSIMVLSLSLSPR